MKVLYLNNCYIYTKLHQEMVDCLTRKGVEPEVFVPVLGENESSIVLKDYEYVPRWIWSKKWLNSLPYFYWPRRLAISSFIAHKYDISSFDCIHASFLFLDGGFAYDLQKRRGIPYIVTVRFYDMYDFFQKKKRLRWQGVRILKEASAVIFLSSSYRDRTIGKYVPNSMKREIINKSYVIPNGINDFWFSHIYSDRDLNGTVKRIKDKTIKIVSVGIIDERKNYDATCKACEVLKNRDWDVELVIAGRIQDHELYNRIAKYVSYRGKLNREEIIELYREGDIFVLPSHKESFGLVYAEAMSQGLPVIYTRGEGFDGQFEEGIVGFSVDDNNPVEIADSIEKICFDYERISENCLRLVDKFKWDKICDKYLELYRKAVSNNPL